MALTAADRVEIHEVIALHGHLCDAGSYDRFDEVFADDLEVDAGDLGLAPLPNDDTGRTRLAAYISAAHRRVTTDALALHVTNVIVGEDTNGAVRAWSKGLAFQKGGSVSSVVYEDELVLTSDGWRIRRRRVSARR